MKISGPKLRALKEAKFEVQQGCCAYCGREMQVPFENDGPEVYTLDHIIPLAKGGTWAKVNLTLAHKKCNGLKGCLVIPVELLNDKPRLFSAFRKGTIKSLCQ